MSSVASKLARPFTALGQWYNSAAQSRPVVTAVVTTGLKTSAADLFAQKVIEKREEIDWRRHAVFCTFGIAYLGGFQYWLYNIQFTRLCAPITAKFGHKGVAPLKVLLDQGIHHPLVYFPVFYSMKAFVEGKPMSTAWDKYRTEIKDSCTALWKIWVPAQAINFAFVPRHMRIPFVAAVSFGWTVVLSVMQGKFDAARLEAAAETAAAAGASTPSAAASTASTSGSEKEGGGAGAVKGGVVAAVAATPAPGNGGSGSALAPPTPPRGLKELASGGGGGGGGGGRIVAASASEAASRAAALATAAAAERA